MNESLAPGLIIAMPDLLDPNFFRSVVLMCAHSEEGAFGLILNHPLDILVADVCAETKITWKGERRQYAFSGGPVEPRRGWLLHSDEVSYPGSQSVGGEMSLSASQEALATYADDPKSNTRLILGYAGWGPGQLEEEVALGSWLSAPADAEIVFGISPTNLWEAALRIVGINPTHLVGGSDALN